MTSTVGGNDPKHDLPPDKKDEEEQQLRAGGRKLRRQNKPKEARKKFDRANEISREKSKKAQHH